MGEVIYLRSAFRASLKPVATSIYVDFEVQCRMEEMFLKPIFNGEDSSIASLICKVAVRLVSNDNSCSTQ